MFGKVAVLMGGTSAERDISLMTGQSVLKALQEEGIEAHPIDTQDDFIPCLTQGRFDRAFIALHGRGGEDGTIQGLLEHLRIPFTGSGVLGSALAMDKVRSKQIWQALGLPTLPFEIWQGEETVTLCRQKFSLPLCVKPVFEGSSMGVFRVETWDELLPAVKESQQFGEVMIEPWLEGEEWTVGVLGERALPAIWIQAANKFYDYQAKYFAGTTRYICPGPLDEFAAECLGRLALEAFSVLSCQGWGRVDFIRDKQGHFWLLEVNTVPGLTETSLVPKAAKACGLHFQDLVIEILSQTFASHQLQTQRVQKSACEAT